MIQFRWKSGGAKTGGGCLDPSRSRASIHFMLMRTRGKGRLIFEVVYTNNQSGTTTGGIGVLSGHRVGDGLVANEENGALTGKSETVTTT